jgi:hypothetical protein
MILYIFLDNLTLRKISELACKKFSVMMMMIIIIIIIYEILTL